MSYRQWGTKAVVASVSLVTACSMLAVGGQGIANASQAAKAVAHTSGPSGVLTITTGAAGIFADDFNQFSPNAEDPTRGMIYEPLFFFDTADAGKVTPWLGQTYVWSNSGRTLTFTLRQGVKWSDGTPFTSADVAFTFNLLRTHPLLNQNGIPFASIKTEGPYKVVVNFTKSAYADLNYVAGLTYILPEHIWKNIKNPQTFTNTHPVGTGAYEVSSVSGDVMSLTANPHYYMPGLPKFKTIRFLSFSGNTSSDLAIESGQLDWAGSYIPNIKKNYLDRNSKFTVSDIPLSIAYLVPNMKSGPTTSLAVREALSAAINRNYVSKVVYNGYANPTNPESVLTPNFAEILDPTYKSSAFTYSVSTAKKILESAGYKMGSNGFFEKNGNELTLTVQVVSGYTDYVQDLDIIAAEAKAAGINLVVDGVSYAEFTSNQDTGNFQLLIDNFGYTPSPYVFFNNLLNGSAIPAEGKIDTAGDFGRYNNTTVDSMLNAIGAAPNVTSVLHDYYRIEQIFKNSLPLIPLFDQQDEQEFNGNVVTGEPTLSNPYAASAVYIAPDLGWVAMHIAPAH